MDPTFAFVLGAAVSAVLAAPFLIWHRRQRVTLAARRDDSDSRAATIRRILETSPDGFFAWSHSGGETLCSRRLAVLLDLPGGTRSSLAEMVSRFEGQARADLEEAIIRLRREGLTFGLELNFPGGRRRIQVVGLRAADDEGRPIADILWMRGTDIDEAAVPASALETGALRTVIDALPFPAWVRDGGLDVVYANSRSTAAGLPEATRDLAARAGASGQAASDRHDVLRGERLVPHDVTESPIRGTAATIGIAVERPASDSPAASSPEAPTGGMEMSVLDNMATAVAIYGADSRLTFFNAAFARLWRLDSRWLATSPGLAEVLDRLRDQRRLPEFADFRAFREQQLSLFRNLSRPVETPMHLPDGRTLRCTVMRDPQGGLVFSYDDVTDRLDLERSVNALAAVQKATLDNLYEGVAVFGADGRLKLSNPVFAAQWGLDEAALNEPLHLTGFVQRLRPCFPDADDWPRLQTRIVARLMRRETGSGRLDRDDGRVFDYATVPLPDGAVLVSYLDVTEAVTAEQALRERAQALHEANRLKSEFIAKVSYEVRTPLTTIIGFADLLNAGQFGTLSKRQLEYSQGILDSARSLMTVVGDILDLTAIEAGLMTLELDAVDVHAMLAGILPLVRERARRKELKLDFDCPPDIGWIVADEKRLKQVVFNLLGNAVDFTRARGSVAVSARREGDRLTIAVSDTGVGIATADQARLFDAFERGPAADMNAQGVGLGLTVVKRFVELHGGTVALKSVPNRGTTVTCNLPVGQAERRVDA